MAGLQGADANVDGELSWSEYCAFLMPSNTYYCMGDGERSVATVDTNSDSAISYDELATFVETTGEDITEGKIDLATFFNLYDYDNSGLVTADEIDSMTD